MSGGLEKAVIKMNELKVLKIATLNLNSGLNVLKDSAFWCATVTGMIN